MIKIDGRKNDLGGGMIVQRILPFREKRTVGPFCFLDHMGPLSIAPNQNTDVRPHPHIGLSTLTYLFDGRIFHRDSLGNKAAIEPGGVNWMTAGKGISHSERTPENERASQKNLHGLQFWVALPDGKEDIDPSFDHYEKTNIPHLETDERKITLVAGEGFGLRSPVKTSSPLIFANIQSKKNHSFEFRSSEFELGVYIVSGSALVGDVEIAKNQMIAFDRDTMPSIQVREGTHYVLIGGEPLASPRHLWWNLVSSSKEKIELAKKQWREGRFPMVPGETEFIPLPEK